MSQSMLPCPSCQRHTRVSDPGCPFCGAVLPSHEARKLRPAALPRMSRAAMIVLGASLSVAACGPANPQPVDPVAPAYGAPPPDEMPEDAPGAPGDNVDKPEGEAGDPGDADVAPDTPVAIYGAPAAPE